MPTVPKSLFVCENSLLSRDNSNSNRTSNISDNNNSNENQIQSASNDDTFSNYAENDTSTPEFQLNKSKS